MELSCLLLADRNTAVIEIYSQPFRLVAACTDGRTVRMAPDYMLAEDDGSFACGGGETGAAGSQADHC